MVENYHSKLREPRPCAHVGEKSASLFGVSNGTDNMNYQDYLEYSKGFTGKSDEVFRAKFTVDPKSLLEAEEAFKLIDTHGKHVYVPESEEVKLLAALKGKAAFNFRVKQVADTIKLAHNEKWTQALGVEAPPWSPLYKKALQLYLGFEAEEEFFELAWKQARIS